jgi:hypothetical protein
MTATGLRASITLSAYDLKWRWLALTMKVDGRLAQLISSVQIDGFQCWLLPLQFSVPIGTGMVSIFFCQRMQARQARDIRIVPMFGKVPVNTYQRIGVGIVRANRILYCRSPVCASRSSAPVALAAPPLTRSPAPGVLPVGIAHGKLHRRELAF